jgi:hypothetical protein
MAENTPNAPTGGVPPKPGEAAKVQPKKETVRITLPPKPSASPTIKLPSITATPPPPPTAAAPKAAPAPAAAAPATTAATLVQPAPGASPASRVAAAPKASPRPPARPSTSELKTLDKILAIAAAVIALGSVVSILLLLKLGRME